MARDGDDFFTGYIEEVQSYIPLIAKRIEALQTAPDKGPVFEEIYRLVHIIHGASVIVGVNGLGSIAGCMKNALDGIRSGQLALTTKAFDAMLVAVDCFTHFCGAVRQGIPVDDEVLLARTKDTFARIEAGNGQPIFPVDEHIFCDDEELFLDEPLIAAAEEEQEVSAGPLPFFATEGDLSDQIETVSGYDEVSDPGDGSLQGHLFSEEEQQLLRDGFFEEAEEHLHQVHQSMQNLENQINTKTLITSQHREEIRTIRRAVHTIKGAAAVIGFNDIASYAHHVEDGLDWLYEQAVHLDPVAVNVLAEALSLLGVLVESPQSVLSGRQTAMHRRLQEVLCDFHPEVDISGTGQTETPTEATSALAEASTQPALPEVRQLSSAETEKTFRVGRGQLDSLLNLTNELLVGVSGFDHNMDLFKDALAELALTTRRLKDIAYELETQFEVKALGRLSRHFTHLDASRQSLKDAQSLTEFNALELDRYTRLNLIIRSLNETAVDVAALHGNLGRICSGIGSDISRQHRFIREVQVQLLRARMNPLSILVPRLSRTTREVAGRLGKKVRLVVEGEQVELDRLVWEKLADPFMHLVRNATHHGIEAEKERLALGKHAEGIITVAARREGNTVVIRFHDDGRGLDFEVIREKARQFGFGTRADALDEQQLMDLIFYPGFSTQTISEISGRGVGMDVVKENVHELQGSIAVETVQGQGTAFVLRIPLTMGVLRALLVKVGEVTYAIAINDIKNIQRVDSHALSRSEKTFAQGETTMPWHSLRSLLHQGEDENEKHPLVLVLDVAGRTMALSVPQITGQKELVVKGLGCHLRAVPGLSGAAIMGDGSVVPVLNIPELVEADRCSVHFTRDSIRLRPLDSCTVMIVDDSISIRRVMSRLIAAQGWIPLEAKDGFHALEQLNEVRPDCLVLDVEMPRMNGFEFLSKLNNRTGGKEIPVIMLTSRTSAKHREKALQLGASAFLNKPCTDEELVTTVLRVTGRPADSEESTDGLGEVRV
ncbi:hybrid sensor histidine kinase/response regulator [Desulfobulbus alkaliphilus]|uniref:hybrid sensor histidine kinase/response regulator n=1 Tax=Desulfobulbus alkaliphilus TaxID=869814 RepID=UPI001964E051|nr:response regulator [Desulfobulbus alkaliphilus]MBM9536452.1 response regulator [Desulfobulbus alkaliphilus]